MKSLLLLVLVASASALEVISHVGGNSDLPVYENDNSDHCTTITAGRKATKDGSTITTHTNDCHQCDSRIFRVPAQDYKEGDIRPVYMSENMEYPRYVGSSRGPGYLPQEGQKEDIPIGSIPQVNHTYAYFDGSYGVMNEHQVAIGESTCSAKIWAKPLGHGGRALFDVIELSRIALERARTAREAIQLMGSLAEKYGYYSQWEPAAFVREEAGETLTVIDPNEAWIFNILADPTGTSAIWAAKRVPDDEVAVTANFFTIDEVDLSKPEFYMASPNVFSVAQEKGWWDPAKERFSFVKAYSPLEEDARDKDYWIVRMWRVFDIIAPSLKLSPDAPSVLEMPFSVKPDTPVTAQDIMRINRDVYEGTEYDLTKGPSAGPFGSPLRMDGYTWGLKGEWARAISLMRTAYSTVLQARNWLPDPVGGIFWLGQDAPHSTVYVPFYAGSDDIAPSYRTGSLHKFTRESAWWAFDFVSNWAEYKWSYMMKEIRAKQAELEAQQLKEMVDIEARAAEMYKRHPEKAIKLVTDFSVNNAEKIVKTWWELADYLIAKYNDGYVNFPKVGGTTGYPAWWLKSVGYDMDPRYKVTVSTELVLGASLGNSTVNSTSVVLPSLAAGSTSGTVHVSTFVISGLLIAVVGLVVGFFAGRSRRSVAVASNGSNPYEQLNQA